jgi:L-alanine-DL-glutamate epimerase-like enolase superfamily enzyme
MVNVFDSTVIEIQTDSGINGYGEICPLGPAYLAAYAAGARTGIATLCAKPDWLGPDAVGSHK